MNHEAKFNAAYNEFTTNTTAKLSMGLLRDAAGSDAAGIRFFQKILETVKEWEKYNQNTTLDLTPYINQYKNNPTHLVKNVKQEIRNLISTNKNECKQWEENQEAKEYRACINRMNSQINQPPLNDDILYWYNLFDHDFEKYILYLRWCAVEWNLKLIDNSRMVTDSATIINEIRTDKLRAAVKVKELVDLFTKENSSLIWAQSDQTIAAWKQFMESVGRKEISDRILNNKRVGKEKLLTLMANELVEYYRNETGEDYRFIASDANDRFTEIWGKIKDMDLTKNNWSNADGELATLFEKYKNSIPYNTWGKLMKKFLHQGSALNYLKLVDKEHDYEQKFDVKGIKYPHELSTIEQKYDYINSVIKRYDDVDKYYFEAADFLTSWDAYVHYNENRKFKTKEELRDYFNKDSEQVIKFLSNNLVNRLFEQKTGHKWHGKENESIEKQTED